MSDKVCNARLNIGMRDAVCHRFAGHAGSHEDVHEDLAWGPPEVEGQWVGDRWVRTSQTQSERAPSAVSGGET